MANNGLPGHVAGTSAFLPISSALRPGADVHVGSAGLPLLTLSGHSVEYAVLHVNAEN